MMMMITAVKQNRKAVSGAITRSFEPESCQSYAQDIQRMGSLSFAVLMMLAEFLQFKSVEWTVAVIRARRLSA
jgi:hypothetical protein